MKNKGLRITLASIVSTISIGGIVALVVCLYTLVPEWDKKALWIPLILGIFVFCAACGLITFSSKKYSDEHKAFWLFFILIIPVAGAIFWLFTGRNKQKGYGVGTNNQTTLLSHIFNAKKSIKIYTNSLFLSNDTIKALNYAKWKDVKLEIVLSFQKSKRRQKLLEYDIKRFFEPNINIYFSNKEIDHNFIIIDENEVLYSQQNFNYKNMYNDSKIYSVENINAYISLWNRDFVRSSIFQHNEKTPNIFIRLRYGLKNIFYPFF